jgi:uncharacterized coiled-coil DUF342 family protein
MEIYSQKTESYSQEIAPYRQEIPSCSKEISPYSQEIAPYTREIGSCSKEMKPYSKEIASYSKGKPSYTEEMTQCDEEIAISNKEIYTGNQFINAYSIVIFRHHRKINPLIKTVNNIYSSALSLISFSPLKSKLKDHPLLRRGRTKEIYCYETIG